MLFVMCREREGVSVGVIVLGADVVVMGIGR